MIRLANDQTLISTETVEFNERIPEYVVFFKKESFDVSIDIRKIIFTKNCTFEELFSEELLSKNIPRCVTLY